MIDSWADTERTKMVLTMRGQIAIFSEYRSRCSSVVERLICNQLVGGSNPSIGSGRCPSGQRERTVNPPPEGFGGSNPPLPTRSGNSSGGRARAFQARGHGFESRFPLQKGPRSSDGQSASLVRTRSPVQIRSWAPKIQRNLERRGNEQWARRGLRGRSRM